eukprot:scaffold52801_cov27-Tisochrysis_lutea.AAC.3
MTLSHTHSDMGRRVGCATLAAGDDDFAKPRAQALQRFRSAQCTYRQNTPIERDHSRQGALA